MPWRQDEARQIAMPREGYSWGNLVDMARGAGQERRELVARGQDIDWAQHQDTHGLDETMWQHAMSMYDEFGRPAQKLQKARGAAATATEFGDLGFEPPDYVSSLMPEPTEQRQRQMDLQGISTAMQDQNIQSALDEALGGVDSSSPRRESPVPVDPRLTGEAPIMLRDIMPDLETQSFDLGKRLGKKAKDSPLLADFMDWWRSSMFPDSASR